LFKAQHDWFDLHKKRPAETTQDEVATAILIVKRYQAMIASDDADLQLNRVNLNYTIGRAPTCGRVDKVVATPGDYLEVGSPVVRLLTTGCGESPSSNTIERRNSPAAAPSTSGPTTTAADPSPPQIPDADSGWVGGGLSPTKFCDPLLAMYKAKYPTFDVSLYMPAERHDATYSLVGGKHDIYRYACSFVAKKK
jgi:hypothetical protein